MENFQKMNYVILASLKHKIILGTPHNFKFSDWKYEFIGRSLIKNKPVISLWVY